MIKLTDEQYKLGKMIFYEYINLCDRGKYIKFIAELSLELGINRDDLRKFKDIYYKKYASFEEKKIHDNVSKLLEKIKFKKMYDSFVILENCVTMSDSDAFKELEKLGKKSVIKSKIKCFVKRHPEYKNTLEELYERYENYLKKMFDDAIIERHKEKINRAKQCYLDLVRHGFWEGKECWLYLAYKDQERYPNIPFQELVRKSRQTLAMYRNVLSENNMFESFSDMLELNRISYFKENEKKINEFIDIIRGINCNDVSFDIIDYYVMLGIPVEKLKLLCKDQIHNSESGLINAFFGRFTSFDQNNINSFISAEHIRKTSYTISNVEITDEIKEEVISLFEEYNIPYMYFSIGLRRYLSGDFLKYVYKNNDKVLRKN